jgi:hypothetical protein
MPTRRPISPLISKLPTVLFLGLFVCLPPTLAQSILPDSFAGWSGGSKSTFNASQIGAAANPNAAAATKEYGFSGGERLTYTRGPSKLDVTLYRMQDPSGGYGEYSYLRTPDMSRSDLTEHSSISSDHALILVGNLVLDVHGVDVSKSSAALKSLVTAVSKQAQYGPLPTLWQELPTDRMVDRSDHYILGPAALYQFFPVVQGDWLGFTNGAEAESAHYSIDDHDVTLMVADFPTPQLASKELMDLGKSFNVNGSNPSSTSPALFARRTVTLISMVYGASSQAEADTLLKQIQYGSSVTWDEPTFQFKEPSIEMMIVGTIEGAGAICLFAIVSGVAFGGIRILTKRFFPDRVFDRSSHLQVLQLGLGSKPINAEDFYGIGPSSKN